MFRKSLCASALLLPLATLGCDGPTAARCELTSLPSAYSADGYTANAAVELDLRGKFKALTQPMKDAEADLTKTPSAADLKALYDDGATVSLRTITSPYYAARVDALLDTFASAAGKTWTPSDPPPAEGGRFGAYVFASDGTDLRQAIEKGLFASAFYNHSRTVTTGPITPAALDRVIGIFGAHPSFPGDDKAAANPDELAAAYAERRDKKDPAAPGPYLTIKRALIEAQTGLGIGDACDTAVTGAIVAAHGAWERAIFGTVIFYLNDATTKLSASSPSDADRAAALHGFGEVVGFIHGWRTLPAGYRTITDAQVDELLTLLGAPPDGPSTAYKLLTDTANHLPKLAQAQARVAAIYGFTAAEIELFKTNF